MDTFYQLRWQSNQYLILLALLGVAIKTKFSLVSIDLPQNMKKNLQNCNQLSLCLFEVAADIWLNLLTVQDQQ